MPSVTFRLPTLILDSRAARGPSPRGLVTARHRVASARSSGSHLH